MMAAIEQLDAMPVEPAKTLGECDDGKPQGPDYEAMRQIVAKVAERQQKHRGMWRKVNIELPKDMEPEEKGAILGGKGRLKVAGPETRQGYLSRGQALFDRYRWETGVRVSKEDMDPRPFVNWLLGLKLALADGTWRNYRLSAEVFLLSIPSDHVGEARSQLYEDALVGADKGRPAFRSNSDNGPVAVSTSPPARMSYQHFQQLRRLLRVMSRSQVAKSLLDLMDSIIHTGVGPMEWAFTELEIRSDPCARQEKRFWLHVFSVKAEAGHITHRTLEISDYTTETVEAIKRTVDQSREWMRAGRWVTRQGEVSRLFRETCRARFPRMRAHYTLSSLRLQFIANMKTIYSREQLAAMTGHIWTDTGIDRSKRRIAWNIDQITEKPIPVEAQVRRMKERLEFSDKRSELMAMRQAARAGAPGNYINDELDDEDIDDIV